MPTEITIAVRHSAWSNRLHDVETVAREAAAAALAVAGVDDRKPVELGVVLADDGHVRSLNRTYRAKDRPTNVLAFALEDAGRGANARGVAPGQPRQLGDVVTALETLEREADAGGLPLADHLSHMVVHGTLHLLGFDHDAPQSARAMQQAEARALGRLGIADPYSKRAQPACGCDTPTGPIA